MPRDSPPTITAANRRGQLTVEELVDGYGIACRRIRDLFVDYLHERRAGIDYGTMRQLATKLVLLFWRDIELHEPGIDSIHLSPEVARAWKERLKYIRHGNTRIGEVRENPNAILLVVRAFYADLNQWALEDPGRWGRWAAPSPVTSRDFLGWAKQMKRRRARMHQRTRNLAPVLPALASTAESRRRLAADALAIAAVAEPGDAVVVDGRWLIVLPIATDPRGRGRAGAVWAEDAENGRRHDLRIAEERAFWAWASVEVLRHTGIRIEEMLEITHRSFVSYTLPSTGELIPLLQITPSKTDAERLMVVSPELADVLAVIIKRVSDSTGRVALCSRYDHTERQHSPELPFLFQRVWGTTVHPMTMSRIRDILRETMAATGLTAADGTPLHITPHDFRRIFATEAVASGLPVHIAAKILGHESLTTTQGYVAVYEQDVMEHHRAFIARRRAMRPAQEYREPTDAEWDEFLRHFERRKVELGVCGRAYATRCIHEHACLRCSLLRPDPQQMARLEEIQSNLKLRLVEAKKRMWLGEVEGIEISLAGAEQKMTTMKRLAVSTLPRDAD